MVKLLIGAMMKKELGITNEESKIKMIKTIDSTTKRGGAQVVRQKTRSAVLYARICCREQAGPDSLGVQQELLRRAAAERMMRVEKEFSDVGAAKGQNRQGFADMVAYLKAHPGCRAILVEKIERLYRNFSDCITIDRMGIEVHLVNENVIRTKGPGTFARGAGRAAKQGDAECSPACARLLKFAEILPNHSAKR
jgi:hypothetical protein